MASIFYAIYDDKAAPIPFKLIHRSPFTVYRTSNMGLIEEFSGMGLDPTAVLLEEDIESIRNGSFANDEVSSEDLEFLVSTIVDWGWLP